MKSKSFFAGRTLSKCFDLAFFSMLLFVFDVKGLIADVSLKGAKITKLDKTK
jgi:lipid-binding SYLF domain-containing protein